MRGVARLALATLAALSACKREPTFDERYAGAQKAISEKASALDQDMAKRAAEAQAIAPHGSESATETPGGDI